MKTLLLLLIPFACYSQTVTKKVTYDTDDNSVISEEIIIGNWHHHFNKGELLGTWYKNDSVNYNYSADGELICKEVAVNDTVYIYRPIHFAWDVTFKEVVIRFSTKTNLFNPYDPDIRQGHSIDYTNGNKDTNIDYATTGYIPVKGGFDYELSYKHNIAWYDENKTYIAGSKFSDDNKTQKAPNNAVYLRCTIINAEFSNFEVIKL